MKQKRPHVLLMETIWQLSADTKTKELRSQTNKQLFVHMWHESCKHVNKTEQSKCLILTYKDTVCVCVSLNWANSERGFCPFGAGITLRHLCRETTVHVNMSGLGPLGDMSPAV